MSNSDRSVIVAGEQPSPILPLIYGLCAKYDVKIEVLRRGSMRGEDYHVKWGSQYCGIDFETWSVLVPNRSSPGPISLEADVLHELAHLIVGEPSLRLCEGSALLQFEWQLAMLIARDSQVGLEDAGAFLRSVTFYQMNTEIALDGPDDNYRYMRPKDRHTHWWREGLSRCQRLGILDHDLLPTFRCAVWTPALEQEADNFVGNYDPS